MDAIGDIKKLLPLGKLIIGAEASLRALRSGKLERVYLAQNPQRRLDDDLTRYAALSGVEVVRLDVPNDELGTLCKKPFPISVIGLKKA